MGIADVIYRSDINGSNIEALLNTSIEVVGEYLLLDIFIMLLSLLLHICNVAAAYVRWQYSNFNRID